MDKKQLVLTLVKLPIRRVTELHHLYLLPIELNGHPRRPVFRKTRKRLDQIYIYAQSQSMLAQNSR